MSVLNDLIKIKTNKQSDDLIKMIDEISVYEKLAIDEKLKDLKTSAATRAKCPLLANFVDGKMYETVLADLVSNVYLQIEGNIPEILLPSEEKTEKQKKQINVLQTGIARIQYCDLMEYNHDTMKDSIAAVFTNRDQNVTMAVIIIKNPDGYVMYHGTYTTEEKEPSISINCTPIIIHGLHGVFTMRSYSILGNNGYRFGTYQNEYISYDIMLDSNSQLYLMNGNDTAVSYTLQYEERNKLHLAKKDPQKFAEQILFIIESVV